jgi:hypothetical protein
MYCSDEFYECMETCKRGVICQSAASARLNLPVRSIIILDLSVMSVRWHILMRIDMFLGVPICEIK